MSPRIALALGLVLLSCGLGGCQAPKGGGGGRTTPYSAYRPRFDKPAKRTLFLGGYAGYNYGPSASTSPIPGPEGGSAWGFPVSRKNSDSLHDLVR